MSGAIAITSSSLPLVVDLDGTLIQTDLLVETAIEFVGRFPHRIGEIVFWLARGKAVLKSRLADYSDFDAARLPFDNVVLDRIIFARANGRRVYLASASNERLVDAVSQHLGIFEGWFASNATVNLTHRAKASRLVAEFGEKGFDYIGNEQADMPVWSVARMAIVINAPPSVEYKLHAAGIGYEKLPSSQRRLSDWVKLLRPQQWVKNALVVIPLLTAHQFTMEAVLHTVEAFIAFSLCASTVYIFNDLVDIQADRQHPTKKQRPFASGAVPLLSGLALTPLLLIAAFGISFLVSLKFTVVLAVYLALTTAYSLFWKRKMLIDVVTLAGLYTIRVIGGAAAIDVPVSQWLLGFSMFLFLSLALIKRYSEMAMRLDAGLQDPINRDYKASDLPVIASLAAAAGYSAVIVFSLYLSSDTVRALYRHPSILWLACPLLLYWISRMLMLSHRRLMDDDPVIFSLKDWVSVTTVALIGVLGIIAL